MHRLLLLLLWSLGPPTLPEDTPTLSLRWQGPSTCMGREQALAQLRELVPTMPERVAEEQGRLAVEVELTGSTPEIRAVVRFRGERGLDERSFAGASCETVATAAVLVIAVAIDPVATAETIWDEPTTFEPEPEPLEPEPRDAQPFEAAPLEPQREALEPRIDLDAPSTDVRTREPRERSRVRGAVGVLGGGGFGPIRAGMGALSVDLAVFGPWWRATLRGTWMLPRTVALESIGAGRYDALLLGGRGCVVPPLAHGRIELPVCAGIEAGALRGQGVGTTIGPRSASQPFVGIALAAGLRYVPRRWIALGLDLDVVATLLRGGFTIGDQVAQQFAPVGVRALGGVELRFP